MPFCSKVSCWNKLCLLTLNYWYTGSFFYLGISEHVLRAWYLLVKKIFYALKKWHGFWCHTLDKSMWLMSYCSTIKCGFRNWKDNPFVWIELRLAGICRSTEGRGNISANTCRMRDTWRLDFDNSDQDLQCNFDLSNNFRTITVYVKDFVCQSHCSYDYSFSYSHFHMITERKNGFVFIIYHFCILESNSTPSAFQG